MRLNLAEQKSPAPASVPASSPVAVASTTEINPESNEVFSGVSA